MDRLTFRDSSGVVHLMCYRTGEVCHFCQEISKCKNMAVERLCLYEEKNNDAESKYFRNKDGDDQERIQSVYTI